MFAHFFYSWRENVLKFVCGTSRINYTYRYVTVAIRISADFLKVTRDLTMNSSKKPQKYRTCGYRQCSGVRIYFMRIRIQLFKAVQVR
jgi:hypothetical protein